MRLIALINPVKVLNNIIHPKSLKKFLGPLFDRLSSKNANVLDFQGLYKHICLLQALPEETESNFAEEVCPSYFDTVSGFFFGDP